MTRAAACVPASRTTLTRLLLIRTGIDPYVGPRALVYPSLAVLVTLVLWVALFSV